MHRDAHHDHRSRYSNRGDRLDGHAPENPSPVFARQNLKGATQSFGSTPQVDESETSSKGLGQFDTDTVVLDFKAHILGHTYRDDIMVAFACLPALLSASRSTARRLSAMRWEIALSMAP